MHGQVDIAGWDVRYAVGRALAVVFLVARKHDRLVKYLEAETMLSAYHQFSYRYKSHPSLKDFFRGRDH